MPDLLLEVGAEEIPARMIDGASDELARRARALLTRERLAESPEPQAFSTPRRIAIQVTGLAAKQPDINEQLTGPPIKAAFKDGVPTAAAHAFAKKVGVTVEQLQRVTTPKGEYLAAQVTTPGRTAIEVLAEALPKEIAALYWPKSMYWRPSTPEAKPERFVRPVRWLVALLDDEIIPLEFAGIRAARESRGHRILSSGAITISAPKQYVESLRKARVIASPEQRRMSIHSALENALRNPADGRRPAAKGSLKWREDSALMDTVVNLTEFPTVILGSFDHEYLTLPEEVLVTVMRDHQKYFAVEDESGKLEPYFLTVLNTNGDPDGLIRHGNERVLRARFNDARFFWMTDQKLPLRDRVELLKHVTFQKDLGSYYEKTMRVQRLGSLICETLKSAGTTIRPGIVHKAALLSKTDLTTELVKEFTELQGVVGGLYLRVQQLHRENEQRLPDEAREAVATAIHDHYKPESMDDAVPRTKEGAVLSIADKADSIAGMFALGLIPSGSKDPFALRRQANAIIRIIAEHKLPMNLSSAFANAAQGYLDSSAAQAFKFVVSASAITLLGDLLSGAATGGTSEFSVPLAAFLEERLSFYLREALNLPYDVVNASLASSSDDVNDAIARARALAEVRGTEDFTSISAAFKRMKNILRQAREKGIAFDDVVPAASAGEAERSSAESLKRTRLGESDQPASAHAASAAEGNLIQALEQTTPRFRSHREQRNYRAALAEIAQLRAPIDLFFDKVMVMVEDEHIRSRRLALLQSIVNEFSSVADFSEMVPESK